MRDKHTTTSHQTRIDDVDKERDRAADVEVAKRNVASRQHAARRECRRDIDRHRPRDVGVDDDARDNGRRCDQRAPSTTNQHK